MIKRLVSGVLVYLVFAIPSVAYANFGLGPCCPPSVCGIIPCDSGCAGAAINQMGSNVASGLNNLNSAHQDLTSAVQDAIDAMTDLGTDLNDALLDQNQDILEGISASTSKIELSNNAASKSLERLSDHSVKTVVNALKQIEIARSTSDNNRMFGDSANPISGETGVNQARAIKTLNIQSVQLIEESTKEFIDYLNDANGTASGAGTSQHRMQSLAQLTTFDRLDRLLTADVLDSDQLQNMQLLIALSVSKYSFPMPGAVPDDDYQLRRKREISMLAIVYAGLMNAAVSKAGLVDTSWAGFYQDVVENQQGNTSLAGYYKADVNGRLTDPEWWGSILRLSNTGLQREKTYSAVLSSNLKMRLDNLSSTSNDLLSIIMSKRFEEDSESLNQMFKSL